MQHSYHFYIAKNCRDKDYNLTKEKELKKILMAHVSNSFLKIIKSKFLSFLRIAEFLTLVTNDDFFQLQNSKIKNLAILLQITIS